MRGTLKEGLIAKRRVDIDADRTISFMGEKCGAYATPKLLHDIEWTCLNLIKIHVDAGKDSVGTRVELDHMGGTLIGMWVEIAVTITKADGAAVFFEFTACDAVEQVARGKHNRCVVGIERTEQRLMAKRDKAASLTASNPER